MLDNLIKSRFVEMFGDPIANSENLVLKPLNDICVKITDGTHDTPPRYSSGYLLITGKNIRSSGIVFDEVEYVSAEDHKIIYDRCNPEYGDVLYTNIGVNYGTACLNSLDYEFSMKNVALLKPNKEVLNGYYLWECLNIMRNYILSMNQVGGAQTFMGLATIKKITIPVSPIEIQNQFAAFVEQTDKLKFRSIILTNSLENMA
ncbi:MAG: restriction endonuclease subunit S [Lachnospiraceae bacterium]|nr:restriction endonuclease subunit S [Lachnospiraceae bacterium]